MVTKLSIAAAALFATLAAVPASAAYLFNVQEMGPDVVITGSGSIDTARLTYSSLTGIGGAVEADSGLVVVGSGSGPDYYVLTGPTNFGSGTYLDADSYSGTGVGINIAAGGALFFNSGYVSGTQFGTSTAIFYNSTLSSLGLDLGTYQYSFGSGADADTVTVQIGEATAALPELATWAMIIGGMGAIGAGMRRKRVTVSYS